MNKRLKEILKQSGLHPYYNAQEEDIKKFAELIVRECADYAFSDDQDHKAMLKHFGVEE